MKDKNKTQNEALVKFANESYKDMYWLGVDDENKLIAQKSKGFSDIYYAQVVDVRNPKDKSKMKLLPRQALNIATLYVGKINMYDPSKPYVFISIEELKRLLGRNNSKIREEELSSWLAYLQSPCVLKSWSENDLVNIFEHSRLIKDDNGKIVGVMLACSQLAYKYIFNLADSNVMYIKIMVPCVLNFSCRYSFIFFDNIVARYFKAHGYTEGFEVKWKTSRDELKTILNCPESYTWTDMCDKAIYPSIKDINVYTPYRVDFERLKHSKDVVISINLSEPLFSGKDDTEEKYRYYDDFDSYENYCKYRDSFSSSERKELEAINQVRNENLGVGWVLNVLRNSLDSELYTIGQLSYLARRSKRFIDDHDTMEIPDSAYVYRYSLGDLVGVIQGFEDLSRDSVINKGRKFAYGKFVIKCFENWISGS